MAGDIDDIKARLDIVDLVSEYIRLQPSGTNHRALCPFHNEKSPSFMVSRDKQIWHCFGCNEGGDIFSFVQKIEGLDFSESLKLLANKAGVKLSNQNVAASNQKNRLLDICRAATSFYFAMLKQSSQAKFAQDYVKQRKISQETIEEFHIGFAPASWDALTNFLKKKGFTDKEIFLAGLSIKKDRGIGFYDRFRNRLMFPIKDVHGNPIGFTARALDPNEKGGKYINTPQTDLYNKSAVLFNLDKAKLEIKKQDMAVIVEGQMDAISAYQAGTKNVIASSGTALTVEQINILKRYTNNVALSFDTDVAGENAARRGIDLALAQGVNVYVVVLPDGKDPDECINTNPAQWHEAVKNPKSIVEYYFEQTFSRFDVSKVEGKKKAGAVLLPVISQLTNTIERSHWLQKLASNLDIPENVLREQLKKPTDVRITESEVANSKVQQQLPPAVVHGRRVLAIALTKPEMIGDVVDDLPPEALVEDQVRELYKNLITYYTKTISGDLSLFDYDDFRNRLGSIDDALQSMVDILTLLAQKDFFDLSQADISLELKLSVKFCKKEYLYSQLKTISERLRQADQSGNVEQINDLSQEFSRLTSALNLLQ
jgi:DNA primase